MAAALPVAAGATGSSLAPSSSDVSTASAFFVGASSFCSCSVVALAFDLAGAAFDALTFLGFFFVDVFVAFAEAVAAGTIKVATEHTDTTRFDRVRAISPVAVGVHTAITPAYTPKKRAAASHEGVSGGLWVTRQLTECRR
jgi:hypothetical protein